MDQVSAFSAETVLKYCNNLKLSRWGPDLVQISNNSHMLTKSGTNNLRFHQIFDLSLSHDSSFKTDLSQINIQYLISMIVLEMLTVRRVKHYWWWFCLSWSGAGPTTTDSLLQLSAPQTRENWDPTLETFSSDCQATDMAITMNIHHQSVNHIALSSHLSRWRKISPFLTIVIRFVSGITREIPACRDAELAAIIVKFIL